MYNVTARYVISTDSIDIDLDDELDQIAGRKHTSESFDFIKNERYLSWIFASAEDSVEAFHKLLRHDAVAKLFEGEIKNDY